MKVYTISAEETHRALKEFIRELEERKISMQAVWRLCLKVGAHEGALVALTKLDELHLTKNTLIRHLDRATTRTRLIQQAETTRTRGQA
jgi:hypothetical protein